MKSVLPVRGMTICAGKLVRKSMLRARNPTDRHARRHTRRALLRGVPKRAMTRSGAARNMGLMRHSRTAVRSASQPTCAHTPTQGEEARARARTSPRGSISFFHRLSTGPPSNTHSRTHAHARCFLPSPLATTSITLISSSLRFSSPLAICSFINHCAALRRRRACASEGTQGSEGLEGGGLGGSPGGMILHA